MTRYLSFAILFCQIRLTAQVGAATLPHRSIYPILPRLTESHFPNTSVDRLHWKNRRYWWTIRRNPVNLAHNWLWNCTREPARARAHMLYSCETIGVTCADQEEFETVEVSALATVASPSVAQSPVTFREGPHAGERGWPQEKLWGKKIGYE